MSEFDVLSLDANALASPVTRTLLIAGARADGMRVVWSAHVEAEADRHARGTASSVSSVRTNILAMELSPTATTTDGLVKPRMRIATSLLMRSRPTPAI